MAENVLQVIGFLLTVLGLLFLIRALGIVNKESPFAKYQKMIGCVSIFVGIIMYIVGHFI